MQRQSLIYILEYCEINAIQKNNNIQIFTDISKRGVKKNSRSLLTHMAPPSFCLEYGLLQTSCRHVLKSVCRHYGIPECIPYFEKSFHYFFFNVVHFLTDNWCNNYIHGNIISNAIKYIY